MLKVSLRPFSEFLFLTGLYSRLSYIITQQGIMPVLSIGQVTKKSFKAPGLLVQDNPNFRESVLTGDSGVGAGVGWKMG